MQAQSEMQSTAFRDWDVAAASSAGVTSAQDWPFQTNASFW